MDVDEARAFLAEHHRAVLATARSDGRPQMSAVTVGVDDQARAVISTQGSTYKVRNIRRDPRVSVFVTADDFSRWIQVDGTATVVSLPEAMEPLVDYYRGIAGEHPDWDEYRSAMQEQGRVLVRVDVERAGPDHHR